MPQLGCSSFVADAHCFVGRSIHASAVPTWRGVRCEEDLHPRTGSILRCNRGRLEQGGQIVVWFVSFFRLLKSIIKFKPAK